MGNGFSDKVPGAVVQACEGKAIKDPEHWLEIELVGEDGLPIAGEKFKIVLPDGQELRGNLDSKGYAKVSGVKHDSNCSVSFPGLDKKAWDFIESVGPRV